MYLANDVIQNSRKKGPEYGQEFSVHLKKAFEHMAGADEKTLKNLDRILTIWRDRGIYNESQINEFRSALSTPIELIKEGPPPKKVKSTDTKGQTKEKKKSENEVTVEVSFVSYSPRFKNFLSG